MSELRDAISVLPAEDLDRLSQGATAEECAEALSDYVVELEAQNTALRSKLEKITMENAVLGIDLAYAKAKLGMIHKIVDSVDFVALVPDKVYSELWNLSKFLESTEGGDDE